MLLLSRFQLYCFNGSNAGAFIGSPELLISNTEGQHPQYAIPEFTESIYEQDNEGS